MKQRRIDRTPTIAALALLLILAALSLATTNTFNLSGQGLISPTGWQLWATVAGEHDVFADSDRRLRSSNSECAALGDVDCDGELNAVVAVEGSQTNKAWLSAGTGTFSDGAQSLGSSHLASAQEAIYVPAQDLEGISFTVIDDGVYRFTITGGAFSPWPCDDTFPEPFCGGPGSVPCWGWKTAISGYIDRSPGWSSCPPADCPFESPAPGDFGVGDPCYWTSSQQAEAVGIGMFADVALEANQEITLLAPDHKGFYGDNRGGVYFSVTLLEPLVASFVYSPENPLVSEEITFDASSSQHDPGGEIISYDWDFGDGNSAEGEVVTHAYTEADEYTVTLTVTDNDGLTDSTELSLEVKLIPVLLVHGYCDGEGMWGPGHLPFDGPFDFKEALVDQGFLVETIELVPKPTNDSIWNYGSQLYGKIAQMTADDSVDQVDIVAHSLGGLAARAYAWQNRSRRDVRTLIMLGTPNNGSGLLSDRYWLFLRPVLTAHTFGFPPCQGFGEAAHQMTPGSPFLEKLNAAGPQPSIENYYTIAGDKEMPILSRFLKGPNDGVVEVASVQAIPGTTNFEFYVNHLKYDDATSVFDTVASILHGTALSPASSVQVQQSKSSTGYQESALVEDSVGIGDENHHSIPIDPMVSEVHFILASDGGELRFTLTSPGGTLITPTVAASDPLITYTNAITTLIGYDVASPEQGNWTAHVAISGTTSSEVSYAMLALLDSDLGLSMLLDEYVYDINDPVPLTAQLVNASGPVTGAAAMARVENPDGGTQVLALYDDGSHEDAQPSDGIYSNLYTNTTTAGAYEITVTASGTTNGEQFVREMATTIWAEQSIYSSCTVATTADSGSGSLRDCIQNASAGDTITFDPAVFPPGSPATIALTSGPLPDISQGNLTIDANNAGVIVDGSALGSGSGIVINSDQNVVKGLWVVDFPDNGIVVCCGGSFNVLGGAAPGEGNVISGNAVNGVGIWDVGTNYNTVIGNFVGTDGSGTVANSNGATGIVIGNGAKFNTIGGSAPGEGNVIGGNINGIGVWEPGTDTNVVVGNYIGVDTTGANPLANDVGIVISLGAQGNTVGPDNVISGNGGGIVIRNPGTSFNTIRGNFVGTDASGMADLGNAWDGVNIDGARYNTIADNIISGNNNYGVYLESSGTMSNTVSGNHIGTDVGSTVALGNDSGGIMICCGASQNTVGVSNIIAFNAGHGVQVEGSETLSNTITHNSIFNNDGDGIFLTDGGNGGLAAPQLTGVNLPGGVVTGTACADCTVEIYSDDLEEGRLFEGEATTDGAGDFVFDKGAALAGPYVTATATDADGNTSEFSQLLNLVLENDHLYIELRPSRASVELYVLMNKGEVIYGDLVNDMFYASIFYQDVFYDVKPSVDGITQESDRVCYHMRTGIDSQLAVTFDLCYVLSGFSVEVVFGNIQETPGYKLIHVRSPDLLTVRATQQNAKLVFPYAEGRLIDIATTIPGFEVVDLDATGWYRPLLAGMLYHDGMIGVCSYDHLDMMMYARTFDHPDEGRLGAIGMNFYYRYAPTDFDSATFIEVFDEETASLSANLTFIADYDGDLDTDWMDGAKVLRDQVQATPDPRYLSSFITKISRNGIGHISEHLQTIEKLYHLTDHNKIYGYLLGYNSQIFEVFGVEEDLDPDFASLADLDGVFQTAEEEYNTFLSFHDNYTDYYPGTPGYDPALRVIQEDGTLAPGWPLPAFPEAFWTDPYDYAVQAGIDRVSNTLSRYPIKESLHIDVLSLVFPNDYSPDSPSSRERNRRGVQLIIDEFNESGVDVTSEGLTGQFVGSGIGWFLDTPRFILTNLPFSDAEFVPLIEFIFHGKTLYGLYEDIYYDQLPPEQVPIYTFLEPLLLGANSAAHIAANDLELDKFYLIDLPWMALNQRFMEDYEAAGSYRRTTYDPDTFVEIDYESNTYTVQIDGRVIGHNYATFFPKDENTFLIYSRDAKTLSESLPEEWCEHVELLKLREDGIRESVPFQITDRTIIFEVEANTPYKLKEWSRYDLDCDCDVDVEDIMLVAGRWRCRRGDDCYDERFDLDHDGIITVVDIMLVVAHWGIVSKRRNGGFTLSERSLR